MPSLVAPRRQSDRGRGRRGRLGLRAARAHHPRRVHLRSDPLCLLAQLPRWDVVTPEKPFVALDNYRNLVGNDDFQTALRNTIWYSLGVVPAQTVLRADPGGAGEPQDSRPDVLPHRVLFPLDQLVGRHLHHLPLALRQQRPDQLRPRHARLPARPGRPGCPTPGASSRWRWPRSASHDVSPWLAGPSVALLSIMMMNVWTTTGTMMVIFLAGLQNIPGDVYEAAAVDGATGWRMFRDITVPLLRPVTLFVVTIGLIGTFQVFDQIFVMSEGGPAKTTTTLAWLVYVEGFRGFSMGSASAIAVVLFAHHLGLFLVQRRFLEQTGDAVGPCADRRTIRWRARVANRASLPSRCRLLGARRRAPRRRAPRRRLRRAGRRRAGDVRPVHRSRWRPR